MNNILLGAYGNLERDAHEHADAHEHIDSELDKVISALIRENKSSSRIREAFDRFDTDGSGELDLDEFIQAYKQLKPDITESQLVTMFAEADLDDSGTLDFDEFNQLVSMDQADVLGKLGMQNRDDRGLIQVEPSTEEFFGEELRQAAAGSEGFLISQTQHLSMELYESRIASLQRFVAMTVMFHQVSIELFNGFK